MIYANYASLSISHQLSKHRSRTLQDYLHFISSSFLPLPVIVTSDSILFHLIKSSFVLYWFRLTGALNFQLRFNFYYNKLVLMEVVPYSTLNYTIWRFNHINNVMIQGVLRRNLELPQALTHIF